MAVVVNVEAAGKHAGHVKKVAHLVAPAVARVVAQKGVHLAAQRVAHRDVQQVAPVIAQVAVQAAAPLLAHGKIDKEKYGDSNYTIAVNKKILRRNPF